MYIINILDHFYFHTVIADWVHKYVVNYEIQICRHFIPIKNVNKSLETCEEVKTKEISCLFFLCQKK